MDKYLTKKDIDLIKYYIEHKACQSPEVKLTNTQVKKVLNEWFVNKQFLLKAFGGQLIHSKTVAEVKDGNLITVELSENKVISDYLFKLNLAAYKVLSSNDYRWLVDQGYIYVYSYSPLVTGNASSSGTLSINQDVIQISKGEKVMKVYKKLHKAFGLPMEEFETFRIVHSQILNDRLIKGELCISIHPLDYMTMSDNESGWKSCMKWDDGGCYKAGTTEMLNSPNVVIAYLKSKQDMSFDGTHSWNNKKWRCLFIVEEDFIMSVRPYPFDCDKLLQRAAEMIAETMNTNLVTHFDISCGEFVDQDRYPEFFRTSWRYITSFETGLMYNDLQEFENSHYLIADIAFPYERPVGNLPSVNINYSGHNECMLCGKTNSLKEAQVICSDCCCNKLHKDCCEICHNYYPKEQLVFCEGKPYCSHCQETYVRSCPSNS